MKNEYSKSGVRLRNKEYIEWLWTQPCVFHGRKCRGGVIAAHGKPWGYGIKGPDSEAIAMCYRHHGLEHDGMLKWELGVRESLVTEHNKRFNERDLK